MNLSYTAPTRAGWARFTVAALVFCWSGGAASAETTSGIVWSALLGRPVNIALRDGTALRGTLSAIDGSTIAVLRRTGRVAVIDTARVETVHGATAATASPGPTALPGTMPALMAPPMLHSRGPLEPSAYGMPSLHSSAAKELAAVIEITPASGLSQRLATDANLRGATLFEQHWLLGEANFSTGRRVGAGILNGIFPGVGSLILGDYAAAVATGGLFWGGAALTGSTKRNPRAAAVGSVMMVSGYILGIVRAITYDSDKFYILRNLLTTRVIANKTTFEIEPSVGVATPLGDSAAASRVASRTVSMGVAGTF